MADDYHMLELRKGDLTTRVVEYEPVIEQYIKNGWEIVKKGQEQKRIVKKPVSGNLNIEELKG